jgi:hypothetical protein
MSDQLFFLAWQQNRKSRHSDRGWSAGERDRTTPDNNSEGGYISPHYVASSIFPYSIPQQLLLIPGAVEGISSHSLRVKFLVTFVAATPFSKLVKSRQITKAS